MTRNGDAVERTRVVYGICRVCKAVCEAHVGVDAAAARDAKITLIERDLIPRDLYVEDVTKWPVTGCDHHPAARPLTGFPAAKDGD